MVSFLFFYFKKPITDRKGVIVAIICDLLFACNIALWNTSIMLSKASISTFLANLSPVWVGMGAFFIMKEKPNSIFLDWNIAWFSAAVIRLVGY